MEAIRTVEAQIVRTCRSAIKGDAIERDVLAVNYDERRPTVISVEVDLAVMECDSAHMAQPQSVRRLGGLAGRLPIIGLRRIDIDIRRRMPAGNRQIHIGDSDVLDGNTDASAHGVGKLPTATAGVNRGQVADADVANDTNRGPRAAATGAITSLQPNRNRSALHVDGVIGHAINDSPIIPGEPDSAPSGL